MKNIYTDRWISFCIIGLIVFVGDCARGILYPALWPLCQDLGGSTVDYGYLVASFSFGRLIISTPLGMISDRYRHRVALQLSTAILCVGAILWACSPSLGGLPTLYIAQIVLGLGTGSLAVTRSYIVEQTVPERRTVMLARLTALQYGGFAGTPILGAGLVAAGASFSKDYQYSLPAGLVLFLAILCAILLIHPFKNIEEIKSTEQTRNLQEPILKENADLEHGIPTESGKRKKEKEEITASPLHIATTTASHPAEERETAGLSPSKTSPTTTQSLFSSTKYHVFLLMALLNFSIRGCIAIYETEISRIFLDTFHFSEWELGITVSMAGILGTVQLVYFKEIWVNHFSDYTLMCGGLIFMAMAEALVINWVPNLHQAVWRTILALYCMYSFSYPIASSAVLGSFAKLQKAGRQSTILSVFSVMGSVARILFPIIAGYCEGNIGSNSSFSIVLILAAVSLFGIVYWKEGILYFTMGDLSQPEPLLGWKTLTVQQWWMLWACLAAIATGFYSLIYDGLSQ